MEKMAVQAEDVARPMGPYTQGIKVRGDTLLFISGQVPEDENGTAVGVGDFRAQAERVMENLKAMVEAAGGTLDDVVKTTVFLTDIEHYRTVSEVRRRYFSEPYPTSTLVEVRRLVRPEWMLEIEAIAVLKAGV